MLCVWYVYMLCVWCGVAVLLQRRGVVEGWYKEDGQLDVYVDT